MSSSRRSRSDAINQAYRNFSNFVLSLPKNANHVATNAARRFSISRSSRNDRQVVPFNTATATATATANPMARGLAKRKRNNLTKKRRK